MRILTNMTQWAETNLGAPSMIHTELNRADVLIRYVAGKNFGLEGLIACAAGASALTSGLRPRSLIVGTLFFSTLGMLILDCATVQANKSELTRLEKSGGSLDDLIAREFENLAKAALGNLKSDLSLKSLVGKAPVAKDIYNMNKELIKRSIPAAYNTILLGRLVIGLQDLVANLKNR